MVLKTIFMLSLMVVPLTLIITGVVQSVGMLFLLYILSGFGMAGIGMGIMHDAIHGSYSKNKLVNKIIGYTSNLIGANDSVWRMQHNVLHHTYTNVEDADDDINTPFFLRFSPNRPKNKLHQYQHWYTWFFYGLSTISWVTTKDFIRLRRYRNMGLIRKGTEFRKDLAKMIMWKVVYYIYVLALPIIFSPFSVGMILLAFLAMHFVTGLSLSLVFQTAHVMPDTDFPLPDDNGVLENERLIHQMLTTCNFAPRSRVFSWLIGGLNYQVEHHLFPHICHVHYRKIAPIVKQTADEYGVPYLYKKTFVDALVDHFKMLRTLGTMEPVEGWVGHH